MKDQESKLEQMAESEKKVASFKLERDGMVIEFNLTINIYNTNDNKNNLANQGGKAGVSNTASEYGQISGSKGTNMSLESTNWEEQSFPLETRLSEIPSQINTKHKLRTYKYKNL